MLMNMPTSTPVSLCINHDQAPVSATRARPAILAATAISSTLPESDSLAGYQRQQSPDGKRHQRHANSHQAPEQRLLTLYADSHVEQEQPEAVQQMVEHGRNEHQFQGYHPGPVEQVHYPVEL